MTERQSVPNELACQLVSKSPLVALWSRPPHSNIPPRSRASPSSLPLTSFTKKQSTGNTSLEYAFAKLTTHSIPSYLSLVSWIGIYRFDAEFISLRSNPLSTFCSRYRNVLCSPYPFKEPRQRLTMDTSSHAYPTSSPQQGLQHLEQEQTVYQNTLAPISKARQSIKLMGMRNHPILSRA